MVAVMMTVTGLVAEVGLFTCFSLIAILGFLNLNEPRYRSSDRSRSDSAGATCRSGSSRHSGSCCDLGRRGRLSRSS